MYAVIVTGGKQYRVTAGSIIEVEKLEAKVGDTVTIETVLALSGDRNLIGTPSVAGAVVEAQVLEQGKADKVLIFKKKRRHNYKRKNGHRQRFTALHITSIALNGKALVSAEKRQPKPRNKPVASAAAPKSEKAAPAAKKASAEKKPASAKKPASKKVAK
jgi:large subunit ribosomal protein L21